MFQQDLFSFRSATGLALALAAALVVLAIPRFSAMKHRNLAAVATGLLAFQVFHFFEHAIQLGYWVANPGAAPFMTPWATSGAEGLGYWCSLLPGAGRAGVRGVEALHLVGNTLFLVGLIALGRVAKRSQPSMHLKGLRTATVVQWVHVVEHVLLVSSVFVFGDAIGISTLFGFANGASWGPTTRVWFHFLINLAATAPAVVAYVGYLDEVAHRNAVRDLQPAHAEGLEFVPA